MTGTRFFQGFLVSILVFAPAALMQAQPQSKQRKDEGTRGKEARPVKDGPEFLSQEYIQHLQKGLKLDEGQSKEIGSILDKARPDLSRRFEEMRAAERKLQGLHEAFEKSQRALHERIREKLGDEQKEQFDLMRLRMRKPMPAREGQDMRGVEFEPGELPPEVREKMDRKRKAEDFPPERWEKPQDLEKGENLPPEIREHIEKRLRKKDAGEGQKDLPPPEEWRDGME